MGKEGHSEHREELMFSLEASKSASTKQGIQKPV